jgi:hypothetical protein
VAGIVKWLSWETENILGISKTQLIRRAVNETLRLANGNFSDPSKIAEEVGLRLSEETRVADAQSAEARPVSNTLTSPLEAQRRLRTFGEDYLNKELDLFLSILPDKVVGNIISALKSVELAQDWNIIGNSNDLEDSTGMKFMQVDTLAYSDRLVHLVAIEQKIDAKPMDDQALKYAAAAAYFEVHDFIPKGTRFSLLFIT